MKGVFVHRGHKRTHICVLFIVNFQFIFNENVLKGFFIIFAKYFQRALVIEIRSEQCV